jgi:hypothetical protein
MRPGPLAVQYEAESGNRDRRAIESMAGLRRCSLFWEAGHGIQRSNIEVSGLRRRFCVYRGRASIFPRQAIQERPQALQAVQGEAQSRVAQSAAGDADKLLRVRHGNYSPVQAHAGPAGAVPFMLPEAAPVCAAYGPSGIA